VRRLHPSMVHGAGAQPWSIRTLLIGSECLSSTFVSMARTGALATAIFSVSRLRLSMARYKIRHGVDGEEPVPRHGGHVIALVLLLRPVARDELRGGTASFLDSGEAGSLHRLFPQKRRVRELLSRWLPSSSTTVSGGGLLPQLRPAAAVEAMWPRATRRNFLEAPSNGGRGENFRCLAKSGLTSGPAGEENLTHYLFYWIGAYLRAVAGVALRG
jgi:hypothetical protein